MGNGGILGPLTPLAHADPKDWNKVMAVNVTANWRLIRSLDPLLRASDAGRALFITSGAAHRARMKPYWGPYAVSKAALEAIARTYAAETENTSSIKVMLANPGPLRTRMRALAMPGEDPATLRAPEEFAEKRYLSASRNGARAAGFTIFQATACWISRRQLSANTPPARPSVSRRAPPGVSRILILERNRAQVLRRAGPGASSPVFFTKGRHVR